jgi:hypothetical protein
MQFLKIETIMHGCVGMAHSWLSPIVVVLKKNGKLKICVDFNKLNVVIKKDPYMLPFTNEVINTITRHEVYTFLGGFSKYHQISIALEN